MRCWPPPTLNWEERCLTTKIYSFMLAKKETRKKKPLSQARTPARFVSCGCSAGTHTSAKRVWVFALSCMGVFVCNCFGRHINLSVLSIRRMRHRDGTSGLEFSSGSVRRVSAQAPAARLPCPVRHPRSGLACCGVFASQTWHHLACWWAGSSFVRASVQSAKPPPAVLHDACRG